MYFATRWVMLIHIFGSVEILKQQLFFKLTAPTIQSLSITFCLSDVSKFTLVFKTVRSYYKNSVHEQRWSSSLFSQSIVIISKHIFCITVTAYHYFVAFLHYHRCMRSIFILYTFDKTAVLSCVVILCCKFCLLVEHAKIILLPKIKWLIWWGWYILIYIVLNDS